MVVDGMLERPWLSFLCFRKLPVMGRRACGCCRITTTTPPTQFLDIPSGTRDLTRHLEDLTCQYPVKPVERTSLRFCEALAQWRGKPELEKVSPHLHSTFF